MDTEQERTEEEQTPPPQPAEEAAARQEPDQPESGKSEDDLSRKIEELTADLDAKNAVIAQLRATIAAMQEEAGIPVDDNPQEGDHIDMETVSIDDLFEDPEE